MTSLIGIPVIVAAWAVPALFLCLLGGLIASAFLRPVYRAWALAFDITARHVARMTFRLSERLATRSYDYAVRHVSRGR